MPTVRTVTVKSAGGDYSSLSSAEAGEQGNLVSLDRQLDIECYSMNDTANVVIVGWTTSATQYIRVFTPSAERHAGLWNGSKYNLTNSTTNQWAINVQEEYVRLEGLQVYANQSASHRGCVITLFSGNAASSDCQIDSCIMRHNGGGATDVINHGGGTMNLRNTVVYGGPRDGLRSEFNVTAPTLNVDNCTLTKNAGYGINNAFGTVTVRNTYCGGNTTNDFNGTITRTTCAHSTATVFANSTASIAHDATNFTNITGGSEDYHLAAGASATLKTGGTDLSGTFTLDIDGETRSDWSIGADEIVAAPGGVAGCPLASRIFSGSCFGGKGVILCL